VFHQKTEAAFVKLSEEFHIKQIFCQKEWTKEEVDVLEAVKN
jgi:deoxyribodipyrimidine photo-lyase